MAEQKDQSGSGFPQNQSGGQDTHSTTGDGHPPRPGEQRGTQEGNAGQGLGQGDGDSGGVGSGSGSSSGGGGQM